MVELVGCLLEALEDELGLVLCLMVRADDDLDCGPGGWVGVA